MEKFRRTPDCPSAAGSQPIQHMASLRRAARQDFATRQQKQPPTYCAFSDCLNECAALAEQGSDRSEDIGAADERLSERVSAWFWRFRSISFPEIVAATQRQPGDGCRCLVRDREARAYVDLAQDIAVVA